ncbi:hypothetical protein EJV47_08180 [Hymenobacter gummosus]|uniref:Glycosyltransferase RgtA/B/C/D-like domain-containing protein n=1 Tax=Hymenobacter gummosus TaxID=1776032 RepID=A0A431U3Y6_9BACT|nr:hypothetical protein [Hymenobacter gummosus]RTQ50605.1 hypothetical protein EJV47_08180 [Hymenobacter gummosus]
MLLSANMMSFQDLFLTPIYLLLLLGLAYALRGRFTNAYTRRYFIPAYALKLGGAIALGLIYEFYYSGGDTTNYYNHAALMYKAFGDSFPVGLKLLTSDGEYDPAIYPYTSQMFWFTPGSTEMVIVRIAAVIALLCFNTYTVMAMLFATLSFTGMWAMYITFVKIRPQLYKQFTLAVFFMPSVFFWGSGLMKDSICIGALGLLFYGFYKATIQKRSIITSAAIGFLGAYVLYVTKVYILLSFLPPAMLWVFNENSQRIQSSLVRMLAKPVLIAVGVGVGAFAATNLTAGDERFDVEKIGERSKITKEYLSEYVTSGSAYDIGELDGSLNSIVKVAPMAVFTALFRPFLFEARNPVMLLSAMEATFFIYLTVMMFFRTGLFGTLRMIATEPTVTFCFLFAIIMAVGVGTTSGNFGTLVRYKIPLMPFFLAGLFIMQARVDSLARLKRGNVNLQRAA